MPNPPKAQIDKAISLLIQTLTGATKRRIVSIILYGSYLFDDLAPGYGDFDFIAASDQDLDEKDCADLIEARKYLRTGSQSSLEYMLEGAILPVAMLNPNVEGRCVWWGTTRETMRTRNQLGPLVLHVIRERGDVVWGEDIRNEIPSPSRDELLAEIGHLQASMIEHGRAGSVHSIDWLLSAARALLFLREGRLSSKSEAADWGAKRVKEEWGAFLPKAKATRLSPSSADAEWLETLDKPIQAAAEELGEELAKHRRASSTN